jgi:hypothetical protein
MKSKRDIRRYWNAKAFDFFRGKKIAMARYLTEREMITFFGGEKLGSNRVPIILEFDDRSYAIPFMDDEGNDGGAIYLSNEEGVLPVLSRGD